MLYLDRLITESKILQLIPGPVLLRQSEVVTKSYLWVELGKEVLKPMYVVCGNHCTNLVENYLSQDTVPF